MEYQSIVYTPGKVATILLNRPERMNALSRSLLIELQDALVVAERDPDVRVIVIKGAGRTFSAGYDLTSYGGGYTKEELARITPELAAKDHVVFRQSIYWTIWDLLKPVIAQVHGYALAGGSELALMCDMTICADDAKIGYPPVRMMSTPDTLYHPWLFGLKRCKLFMFTGDSISGKTAADWGVATLSFPPEELEQKTRELAERVALIPTELLCLQKSCINMTYETMGFRTAMTWAQKHHDLAGKTAPAQEWKRRSQEQGVNAALEWRDGPFGDYRAKTTKEEKEAAEKAKK